MGHMLVQEVRDAYAEILEEELRRFRNALRENDPADSAFHTSEAEEDLITEMRERLASVIAEDSKRTAFLASAAEISGADAPVRLYQAFCEAFSLTDEEYAGRITARCEQSLDTVYEEYRRGIYDYEGEDPADESAELKRFRQGILASCQRNSHILLEGKESLNAAYSTYDEEEIEERVQGIIRRYMHSVYRDSIALIRQEEYRQAYTARCEAALAVRKDGRIHAGELYMIYVLVLTGKNDETIVPAMLNRRQRTIMGNILRN